MPHPVEVLETGTHDKRLASMDFVPVANLHDLIPGLDPLMMDRYPAASVSLEDWVARLD